MLGDLIIKIEIRMMVIPYHPFLPYDGHSVLHSVYSIRDFPEVVFA